MLRPSPFSAKTKEYFIGASLLIICYLNAFLLHPIFFQRNKIITYVVSTIICLIVAILIEFSWLYNDIMSCIPESFSPKEVDSYYRDCIMFASLRDVGLLSFTFLFCELCSSHNQKKQTERLLMTSENKIQVKDYAGNTILLNYKQIRFCEQERNVTKIYGSGNNVYFRYGSLRNLQMILGNEHFVQISRRTLVMKKLIKKYSDSQVWLVDEESPFEVSTTYRNQINLLPSLPNPDSTPIINEKRKRENMAFVNNKTTIVYNHIVKNPGISSVRIMELTSFSPSTVNRILAQLKKEGLIEYVGSKKTGGYRVREIEG